MDSRRRPRISSISCVASCGRASLGFTRRPGAILTHRRSAGKSSNLETARPTAFHRVNRPLQLTPGGRRAIPRYIAQLMPRRVADSAKTVASRTTVPLLTLAARRAAAVYRVYPGIACGWSRATTNPISSATSSILRLRGWCRGDLPIANRWFECKLFRSARLTRAPQVAPSDPADSPTGKLDYEDLATAAYVGWDFWFDRDQTPGETGEPLRSRSTTKSSPRQSKAARRDGRVAYLGRHLREESSVLLGSVAHRGTFVVATGTLPKRDARQGVVRSWSECREGEFTACTGPRG